ncbi:MAG: nitrate ABC transporter [Gammaproteobacteria bacterium]|nr:MAG: nitrate ABC transporter [Gammaproteobacteria bacterium]
MLLLRNAGFFLLTLLILSVLFACSAEQESPLRVGTNIWPGYEPFYLARELGYYEQQPVHLVELKSATEVIHAIRNNTIEAAALTIDEAMLLLELNIDVCIIAVTDISNGGDVVLGKPGIKSLSQLKGKRIAVEHTALGALMLGAMLKKADLSINDVLVVPKTVDEHVSAYRKNKVDAVVTFEPYRSILLAEGAQLLFDSRAIPEQIIDVLVIRKDAVKNHTQSIKTLVHGFFKAAHYLKEKPQDAAKRMASRLNLTPEEVLLSYDGLIMPSLNDNKRLFKDKPSHLDQSAQFLLKLMLQEKLISRAVKIDDLFNSQWLPENL